LQAPVGRCRFCLLSADINVCVCPHADGHAEPPAKKQRVSNGSAGLPTPKLPGAIVLDIEGTVAAISFVTEVRF